LVRAAALALSVLTGCDAPPIAVAVDASTDTSTVSPLDAVLADGARLFCEMHQKCDPRMFAIAFGDMTTCKKRQSEIMSRQSTGVGVVATPEQRRRCYQALWGGDCVHAQRVLYEGVVPDDCRVPGTLPIDAPCASRWQCQSMRCTGICGTCVAPVGEGAACYSGAQCEFGSICWGGQCIRPRERGEACDAAHICHVELNCVAGRCVDPPKLSDPCAMDARFPCGAIGKRCDKPTNTCQPMTIGKLGDPCGSIDDYPVDCAFGLSCRSERPNENGVCVTAIPDGARCGTFSWVPNNGCHFASVCSLNICRIPHSTDCSLSGVVP
jgi:hypothetical protein